jgi:hypothetical protein
MGLRGPAWRPGCADHAYHEKIVCSPSRVIGVDTLVSSSLVQDVEGIGLCRFRRRLIAHVGAPDVVRVAASASLLGPMQA